MKHSDAVKMLAERFNEHLIWQGAKAGAGLLELFAAAGGKTWTLALRTPDGRSCQIAEGEGWLSITPEVKGTAA